MAKNDKRTPRDAKAAKNAAAARASARAVNKQMQRPGVFRNRNYRPLRDGR